MRRLKAAHTLTYPGKPIGKADDWQASSDADRLLHALHAEAIRDDE